MKDILAAILCERDIISLPRESSLDAKAITLGDVDVFYQVLEAISAGKKFIKPAWENRAAKKLFPVVVQELHVWDTPPLANKKVDVYVMSQPFEVDAACWGSAQQPSRMRRWSSCASDVGGCMLLHSPRLVGSHLCLTDAGTPAYSWLKALQSDGWEMVPRSASTKPGAMEFCGVDPVPYKQYLQ